MRVLKNDLRRAVFSKGFLLTVLILWGMMYFGSWEELNSGRTADIIVHLETVLAIAPASWLFPAIGALCFSDAYVRDLETGSLKYQLVRMNLWKYVLSKVTACFIGACLATMLGIALYLISISSRFASFIDPGNIVGYEGSINCFDILMVEGHYALYLLIHILCEGLAAGMWAVFGMALSSLWPNVYVSYIAPGVVIYAKDYLCAWMSVPTLQALRSFQLGYIANVPGVLLPLIITISTFFGVSLALGLVIILMIGRREHGLRGIAGRKNSH